MVELTLPENTPTEPRARLRWVEDTLLSVNEVMTNKKGRWERFDTAPVNFMRPGLEALRTAGFQIPRTGITNASERAYGKKAIALLLSEKQNLKIFN